MQILHFQIQKIVSSSQVRSALLRTAIIVLFVTVGLSGNAFAQGTRGGKFIISVPDVVEA